MTASAYCGRGNDVGASFCMDCGKPLGTAMAVKATATVGATRAVQLGEARLEVGETRLNDWFDRIDALDGVTLRDSAKAVFDTPRITAKDGALAAYLVANPYAKLDDRTQGCEWARRAASLDALVRSYPSLVQSLCQP